MYISLLTYKHAHTTSHIYLFCSHFPVLPLSCCLGVFYSVFNDHSVVATTPPMTPLLSTSQTLFFPPTHCISYESSVLYSILLHNVAVLCYIACHCLEETQSCLSLSVFSLLSSLRLSPPPPPLLSVSPLLSSSFSSLCFSTIFIPLESPRHATDL